MLSRRASMLCVCVVLGHLLTAEAPSTGCLAADDAGIDDASVLKIAAAHKRLAERISRVSGTIARSRGPITDAKADVFSTNDLHVLSRLRFDASGESIRAEFLALEGPAAAKTPQTPANLPEVLLQTPDAGYRYLPVPTTGSPRATLFQYTDPQAPDVGLRLRSSVWVPLHSLTSMGIRPVVDLLQRPGATLRKGSVDRLADALLLSGSEKSERGELTTFRVVLDPHKDYAVERFEVTSEVGASRTRMEGRVRRMEESDGSFRPRELALSVLTTYQGALQAASCYRQVDAIDYDPAPRETPGLFSIEGFATLGRAFTVVDVNSRDKMQVGKTIPAAPGTTHSPSGPNRLLKRPGGHTRTFYLLLLNGIALLVFGLIVGLRRWRRRKDQ